MKLKRHYDFRDGVKVSQEDIDRYTEEALKALKYQEYYHMRTGNLLLIGIKYDDEVKIFISKGYEEFVYEKD